MENLQLHKRIPQHQNDTFQVFKKLPGPSVVTKRVIMNIMTPKLAAVLDRCKMRNYFWFGTTIPEFLFDGFDIKTPTGFVFMCFGLLSVALLLERIKLYQKYSRCKIVVREAITSESPEVTESEVSRSPETQASCVVSYDSHDQETTPVVHRNDYSLKPARPRPMEHIVDTASFTVVEILNYTLMLCAMLYNGFFVLSIILGSSFGYFLFGQRAYELTVIAGSIEQEAKGNQPAAEQQGRERLSIAARDMLNVVSTSSDTVSSIAASGHHNQEEEHSDESGVYVHTVNA